MSSPPATRIDPSAADVTSRLARRLDAWRQVPLRRHLLAIALLALVLVLRWWQHVTTPSLMNDELIYFRAFDNVRRGVSAFARSGYLSFSTLAHLGALGLEALGRGPTLALLRLANLLVVATAVWCSLAWAPWSLRRRFIVGAIYLVVSPAVAFGMFVANLSLMVSGMIVLSLMVWPTRPLLSGALLAGSVLVKPLAPGAIVTLLAHRPAPPGQRHLIAAGSAIVLATITILTSPELERALSLDPWFRLAKTVSPHKIAQLLDLRGATLWISAAVVALAVGWARRRRLGPIQAMCLALTAAVAATPVVWSHTLLVTLPLQTVALAILSIRFASRGPAGVETASQRERRLVETTLVVLAVAALQLSTGASNIYDSPVLVQWMGVLPPILAPWALVAYVLRRTTPF